MQHILLLHGAIGASAQLQPLANTLAEQYKVHTFDFSGHGGKPFAEEPFSISRFALEVQQYLDEQQIDKADIFGYSMGGYVAILLAKHHPERVRRIITLATKFHWDEATAAKEAKMLQANVIEEKLPAFAQTLKEHHAPNDWKEVLLSTERMLLAMGTDNPLKLSDYATIAHPLLVLLGDRDKMVTLDETVDVYKALPKAQLCILPGTPHPIEQTDMVMLRFLISRFLGN